MTTTGPHPTVAPPTYGALFATRGAVPLYVMTLANNLGTAVQILALSVLVYSRTGSALWSSVAFAAGFLPQVLGGAFLTSLADRLPTAPLLAAGAVVRTGVAGVLAFADLTPAVAVVIVAAAAVVQPVPAAAQSALVARLLSGELYVLGRSVFTVISSGAQLAGLAAGGALVGRLGVSAALAVSAGVQAVGLLAVLLLPTVDRPVRPTTRWDLRDTWRGNARLLADRPVRRILLSWWVPTMLLVAGESLVVAYVGERGGSSSPTGLLLAAFPAGAALGDLVVGRWLPARWRRRSVPWLLTLVGTGLLPLALHPPVGVAFLCLLVSSAGGAYQLGGQPAFLAAVPHERQALAFGLVGTGTMGVQGVGPVVAGALADGVGAGVTMSVLGVAVLIACAAVGKLP